MVDVLVVGGGIAGLRAALAAKAAGASVAMLTQSHPARSRSVAEQDGVNAPETPEARRALAQETTAKGAGLSPAAVVESVCYDAANLVEELDRLGVPFNRDGSVIARAPVSPGGEPRAAYVNDITGLAVTQTLYEQAVGAGIPIHDEWIALSLVVADGRCAGVVALELATGDVRAFDAKAVALATGGVRRAYEPSTASLQCGGSGVALAYRAGAALADMEFAQYYPATLRDRRLALSPLLFGAGASMESESVRLNGADKAEIESRFPDTLHRVKALSGVDLLADAVPARPAMHRLLGGVDVNAQGESSLPGLYAAGECAGNGFHGAEGLDGSFLLVSVASGKSAGAAAARASATGAGSGAGAAAAGEQREAVADALTRPGGAPVAAMRQELAALMHANVGPSRSAVGLTSALQRIGAMRGEHAQLGAGTPAKDYNFGLVQYLELGWLLDAAEAMAATALERKESRGVHKRTDYPRQDPSQTVRLQVTLTAEGPKARKRPAEAS